MHRQTWASLQNQHLEMVIGIEFQLVTFAARLARGEFFARKMSIRTMSIIL